MHAQRKRDVLEYVEIGEQRPTLEQHAELLAHVEQVAARKLRQVLPVDPDLPFEGRNWEAISRSNVVLPQPDGPMMPVTFPRGIRTSMLSKIARDPRLKVRPFNSTA